MQALAAWWPESWWLDGWWSDNGWAFFAGSLVVTALGGIAVACSRSPIGRRRLAETTVAGLWLWVLLASVPGPRLSAPLPLAPSLPAVVAPPADAVAEPTTDTAVAAEPGPWPMTLLGLLLTGSALVIIARTAGASLRLRRLLAESNAAPPAIVALARSLPLAPRRCPRIVVSARATRPFCCGVLRPTVVLPRAIAARARASAHSQRNLRCVLLHELAHLAQGDLWGQLLFTVTAPLQAWNPLFWILRQQARLAAELVADDLAVRHVNKRTYVRELIDLAERMPPETAARAALAIVGKETEFFRRMHMLLGRQDRLAHRCSRSHSLVRWGSALAVAFVASLAWSTGQLPAQDKPPVASAPTPAATKPSTDSLSFTFADESDLATRLARLATSGIAIHGLKVDGGEPRTATVEVSSAQREAASKVLATTEAPPTKTAAPTAAPTDPTRPPAQSPAQTPAQTATRTPTQAATPAAPDSPAPGSKTPRSPTTDKPTPDPAPRTYSNFKDTEVTKVVDTIAKIAGANIVMAPTLTGKVTVQLRNVPWRDALEQVVGQLGHVVSEQANGVLVITKPAAPGGR